MNRTITMNLSGIIFHIEEDAYDKLNKYLSTIRGYFKDSDGRDEIMSDIESRIAEMLQEKVSKTKQAVLMMDVENVISLMGKPEDFAGEGHAQENEKTTNEKASYQNGTRRKRVFRDRDGKMLGGVCAGVGHYFDFDPIWMRLIFAVSFFVFGSGFLLYLILWIIIPEAKTTAEKLEMHGEKVDVNNIGKAVNDEFEDFKKRVKNFGDDIKSPENKDRIKSTAQKATDFAGDVLGHMIRIVGKIAAIFFVFLGIALMIGLCATIFGKGTISIFDSPNNPIHFSLYEFGSAVLPNDMSVTVLVIGIILFVGVPLLSLIYSGIKHLFGIKQNNKIIKYTANSLWIVGLAILIYVGYGIGSDFSEESSTKQNIEILQPTSQVLYLDMKPMPDDDLDVTYKHRRRINFGDWTMLSKDEDKYRLAYPTMDIKQSDNENYQVIITKSANGYNKTEAAFRARDIEYKIEQKDSSMLFDCFYDVKIADKLRAQDVKITLKVPLNKVIFLSKRMEKIIFDIDNVNDALDSDMVNRRWMMTAQGLKCIDCKGLDNVGEPIAPPAPPAPIEKPVDAKKS